MLSSPQPRPKIPPTTNSPSTADLESALIGIRDAVALQNYSEATTRLGNLARIVEGLLPSTEESERPALLASIVSTLEWAHAAVKAARSYAQRDLSSLVESRLYRMPDPSRRTTWNVRG